MDPLNLFKIIAAVISLIIALIAAFIELRLNPTHWLNRWFTLFFITASMGMLTYTIYHFIIIENDFYLNQRIVIPIMITGHILFNFTPVALVMTVFILEKYQKIAMDLRHLGTMMVLFVIMSIGYFIFPPTLNRDSWAEGIIDTDTPRGLFFFVNGMRIVLFGYVVYKYARITSKIEEETKKRVQWFFAGVTVIIIGIIINLLGGYVGSVWLEIFAIFAIDAGVISIVKGFFI